MLSIGIIVSSMSMSMSMSSADLIHLTQSETLSQYIRFSAMELVHNKLVFAHVLPLFPGLGTDL